MPKYDAAVVNHHPAEIAAAQRGMTQADNLAGVDFKDDANLRQSPKYFIFIYNIAPREFEVRRPPIIPCLKMKACPQGESYIKVATLPDIVQEKWIDPDSGQIRSRGTVGERVAMDICNPANTGVDLDAKLSEGQTWMDGGSDDLVKRGLFFSRNDPPEPEELHRAKVRIEAFYRGRLQQAEELAQRGQLSQINQEHHLAADYYGVKSAWHIIAEVPSMCPNCGESVRAGLAYHVNAGGVICVRDWQRTVASGAKKREDVPLEARWWTEEPAGARK